MEKKFKTLSFKNEAQENRVIRFVGSDETVDRDNEILTIDGWDFKSYLKNPVFLWAHKSSELPIGKAVNVGIDPQGKALVFDIEFAGHDVYPFADTIYKLYKAGFLNAVSVGFMPKKMEIDPQDPKAPRKITEKELYELSAVPVPANPNAGRAAFEEAVTKGVINEQEFMELYEVSKKEIDAIPASKGQDEAPAPETSQRANGASTEASCGVSESEIKAVKELNNVYRDLFGEEAKGASFSPEELASLVDIKKIQEEKV